MFPADEGFFSCAAERMNKLAQQLEDDSKDDVYAEKDVCNPESMQKFVDEQMRYLHYGIKEMMA